MAIMRQFKPGQLQTGSLYPISASYALTASYTLGLDTGSLLTTASFNAFTASYTTGSFTGSFRGDGSQLTGIVSSKWTGSNPISRESDVEIIGSLGVTNQLTANTIAVKTSGSYTATLISNALTGSNNYYFPNKQGTLALREDLPNAGSGLTQIITTPDTFKLGGTITENTIFTDDTNTYNISVNGPNIYLFKADSNSAPTIRLNRASGSASTPYPPPSNSYLGVISAGGYDNGVLAGSAALIFQASENFTTSSRGTDLFFNTTPNGTNIPIRRLTIKNDGTVIITGSAAITGSLTVTGSVIEFNMDTFQVKNSSGTTILDVYDSGFIGNDGNGIPAIDTENRDLLDSNGTNSIDWYNRQLYQSDGATITLDWETGALTGSLQGTASFASTASYVNPLRQQILLSGSLKLDPTQDPDPTGLDLDSTVFFQSSSNTALGYDLYVRQNGNLVKWKWIEGSLETGLLYGGVVTYSGSNVFVSPGSGIIAEHNATTGSEVSPMIEYVTWNAITQSITNIATQQVTYIYIDNTGTLQQQSTRFTSQQYHSYIPLGAVGHFDYTQVSAFGGGVQTAYDQISQISNFVDAFGPLKMSGYGLTGQAGSLRLSVGSGTSFIHGGFYQNDPEFPSQITTPSQATASLARINRSGSVIEFDTNAGNLYTAVDPTKYDRDGDGTLANVGNSNWSIQRVFTDPKTGVLYVYYGQARYSSLLNALQYLPTDPFTEGDTFDFTTFVGFLVLKGNASDIADTANNSIINGGLFRGSGQGSGGGIALSNLDDLTDVSITSPTNGQALVYDAGIWKNGTPISASYALTASYLDNYVAPFPFTGSAIISGSLQVTGSVAITGTTTLPKIQDNYASTGSSGQILASDGVTTKWTTVRNTSQIQIISEGPTVVSGSKAFKYIDNDEYITKVTIKSVYTGSIQFILKGPGITYGSASLNNNISYEDSTLTGWNRTIPSGSLIEFVVGAAGGSSSGSASTFLFLVNTTSKIL
jgi:hypothetical protein